MRESVDMGEPDWEPCGDCKKHFDEPEQIVAFFDESGNVIFREDQFHEGSDEQKYFMIIADFEAELRDFIEKVMRDRFGDKWWDRVPEDVEEEAKKRRKTPESPLIDYLSFSDYSKIILRKDNWRELFQKIFMQQDRIKVWLEEISEIRNSVAHSRKISEPEMKTLELDIEKIKTLIKGYQTA